jgi:SAM-dependent methyltransferase
MWNRIARRAEEIAQVPAEALLRKVEANSLSRAFSLRQVPAPGLRTGSLGTTTYSEWCFIIGYWQAFLGNWMPEGRPLRILDIGCGVGRQYLSLLPQIGPDDRYVGLDVVSKSIEICRHSYLDPRAEWIHVAAGNAFYAREQRGLPAWPLDDASFDFQLAISVWTHMGPADFRFYLSEVARTLRPGGRAVITFFILDDRYAETLAERDDGESQLYPQSRSLWIFDRPFEGEPEFFSRRKASVPEVAVAIREGALLALLAELGLKVLRSVPGTWKERPSTYFQDILVLEREG